MHTADAGLLIFCIRPSAFGPKMFRMGRASNAISTRSEEPMHAQFMGWINEYELVYSMDSICNG